MGNNETNENNENQDTPNGNTENRSDNNDGTGKNKFSAFLFLLRDKIKIYSAILWKYTKISSAFLWKHKLKISLGLTILITALVMFFLGGSYVAWKSAKPAIVKKLDTFSGELTRYTDAANRPKPIRIYDKSGELIGEFFYRDVRPVRVDNLSDFQVFIWALLSMEDRVFFRHSGINWKATLRAILVNLKQGRIAQGGSTITQQLAKLSMDLGKRSFFNKMTETYATFYIESRFKKEEILAMYLNEIFLGNNSYGIEAASRYYFNKGASTLTPAEAAIIVGAIPAPSVFNPVRNLHIGLRRQGIVLRSMARNKDKEVRPKSNKYKDFNSTIPAQIHNFRSRYEVIEPLKGEKVAGKPARPTSEKIGRYGYDSNFQLNRAPAFNAEIRNHVLTHYSEEELAGKDIAVYSTLDYAKQKQAEASMEAGIKRIRNAILAQEKKNKKADPKMLRRIAQGMRGSFVSINPSNGDVEVFVSNFITETYRQPGSAIKALVYALAFEKNLINPTSIVVDEEISIAGYSPKNWYSGFRGEVTARRAFAQSMNTIPVVLLHQMGVGFFLEKLGDILNLKPEEVKKRFNRNLTLALGSGELSPLELAQIYATLQNAGKRVEPRMIIKIEEAGAVEESFVIERRPVQVLDPVASAMALNLMEAVVTREGTMPFSIPNADFAIGGKTGTVQTPRAARAQWGNLPGVRDAWFAGAIPNLTTVVWVGNEWNGPFPGGGSGTAGSIWRNFTGNLSKQMDIQGKNLLVGEEIQGNYMQLDICTDDGTQLEPDWEKEKIPVKEPVSEFDMTFNENPEEEEREIINEEMTNPSSNPESDPNSEPTEEPQKPKMEANPRYCKLPAFGQYFYIGNGAPRRVIRKKSMETAVDPETGEEYIVRHRGENTENVNTYTPDEFDETAPGLMMVPEGPVLDGGVELEEPVRDIPEFEDIF